MNVQISNLILFIIIFNSFSHGDSEPLLVRSKRRDCSCSDEEKKPKCYKLNNLVYHYWNECYMKEAECKYGEIYTLVENDNGKCDPNYCEDPFVAVNQNGLLSCNCTVSNCQETSHSEVCGSDGFYYWNDCYAKKQACKSRQKFVAQASEALCGSAMKCGTCMESEVCLHSEIGRVFCACPKCDDVESNSTEICNEHGVGFANECLLRREACERKQFSYEIGNCSKEVDKVIATTRYRKPYYFEWNSAFEIEIYSLGPNGLPSVLQVFAIATVLFIVFVVGFIIHMVWKYCRRMKKEKKLKEIAEPAVNNGTINFKAQLLPVRLEVYQS